MDKVKIGVLGYGVIAQSTYMPALSKMRNVEVVAICDLVPERAKDCAARYNVPQVYTDLDEMLAKSGIDMMVNLTHIQAHFETNLKALQAGKHVYSEKTMTTTAGRAPGRSRRHDAQPGRHQGQRADQERRYRQGRLHRGAPLARRRGQL